MKYYIIERLPESDRTAWNKARADAASIAEKSGFNAIEVVGIGGDRASASMSGKIAAHIKTGKIWKEALSVLKSGDTLFIQLPLVNNYLLISHIFKNLRRRGVEIISLIHDLEVLRMIKDENSAFKQRVRMRIEELGSLKESSRLIVHNPEMKKFTESLGIKTPMTVLGIFDYLIAPPEDGVTVDQLAQQRASQKPNAVIVAGNLDENKSGYIYKLPDSVDAELYGVNYNENDKKNLHYNGSFPADVLPYKLCNGFGLIWDGSSAETCTGAYGEYLRYNNPHKTSLYLASVFPVIIWKEAALAKFVEQNGVGITVSSIDEIPEKLRNVTDEEYEEMYANVIRISKKIRNGEYLAAALDA